jgi:type IV pilus assembly protein PilX
MAGNMRDRHMAFQSAEAALRDGEGYLESIVVLPAFDGTNGLYSLPVDGTKNWEEVDWSDSTEVRDYSGSGFNELADNSSYIIEDLAAAASSDSLEVGVPSDTKRYYRVTARAEGLSNTTEVIIQTVYKR